MGGTCADTMCLSSLQRPMRGVNTRYSTSNHPRTVYHLTSSHTEAWLFIGLIKPFQHYHILKLWYYFTLLRIAISFLRNPRPGMDPTTSDVLSECLTSTLIDSMLMDKTRTDVDHQNTLTPIGPLWPGATKNKDVINFFVNIFVNMPGTK